MRYTGTMKRLLFLVALALSGWAIPAAAAEFSVAVDASPFTLWKAHCSSMMCAQSSDDARSRGLGARAGIWQALEHGDKSGLELGYARLGGNSGSKDYLINTASWSNSATVTYIALAGQAYLGPESGREALTARIGVYDASITTTGTYTVGGPGYTRTVSNAGLMAGVGYGRHVAPQIALTLSVDLFFNVKLADPINPGANVSRQLLRVAVGAEYLF